MGILGFLGALPMFSPGADQRHFRPAPGAPSIRNNMSLMTVFVLPLTSRALRAQGIRQRLLCAGLLVLNLVGQVLTYSRGRMISLAVLGLLGIEYLRGSNPGHWALIGFLLLPARRSERPCSRNPTAEQKDVASPKI